MSHLTKFESLLLMLACVALGIGVGLGMAERGFETDLHHAFVMATSAIVIIINIRVYKRREVANG